MSRYALRNKHKISSHFNQKTLDRIINSLDKYFENEVNEADIKTVSDSKYKVLAIIDTSKNSSAICFYIIRITFDVYNLAFKEFVN